MYLILHKKNLHFNRLCQSSMVFSTIVACLDERFVVFFQFLNYYEYQQMSIAVAKCELHIHVF